MALTIAKFRGDFPEFSSTITYPDSQVTFYLNFGTKLLSAARWQTILDEGLELFIAHNLTLESQAQAASNNGGVPGMSTGMINAKKVDKVSINYDTASSAEDKAGHWNLSIYGQRFIRLARMIGAGPIQVGLPGATPPGSIVSSGSGWSGPPILPGWLSS